MNALYKVLPDFNGTLNRRDYLQFLIKASVVYFSFTLIMYVYFLVFPESLATYEKYILNTYIAVLLLSCIPLLFPLPFILLSIVLLIEFSKTVLVILLVIHIIIYLYVYSAQVRRYRDINKDQSLHFILTVMFLPLFVTLPIHVHNTLKNSTESYKPTSINNKVSTKFNLKNILILIVAIILIIQTPTIIRQQYNYIQIANHISVNKIPKSNLTLISKNDFEEVKKYYENIHPENIPLSQELKDLGVRSQKINYKDISLDKYFTYSYVRDFSNYGSWPMQGLRVSEDVQNKEYFDIPAGPWINRYIYPQNALACFSCGCSCYSYLELYSHNGTIFAKVYGRGEAVPPVVQGLYMLDSVGWRKIAPVELVEEVLFSEEKCTIYFGRDDTNYSLNFCEHIRN